MTELRKQIFLLEEKDFCHDDDWDAWEAGSKISSEGPPSWNLQEEMRSCGKVWMGVSAESMEHLSIGWHLRDVPGQSKNIQPSHLLIHQPWLI